jgi:hypothetical protein
MPKYQVVVTEMWTAQRLYDIEADSSDEAEELGRDMWEEETDNMTTYELMSYLEFANTEVDVSREDGEDEEEDIE